MLKKLNMLALVMLIASQTILGPMASAGVVFAEAGNNEGNEGNGEGNETTEEVVNKDDLEDLLKDVVELKAEDFSEKTFKALEDAVEDAEKVFENNDATQDEVDKAIKAVEDAVEDLDVDKVALTTLLDDNAEKAEEDYTADSFADFVETVTAGEKVADKEDATQKDVNEVVTEIEKAIDALQKQTTEDDGDAEEGTESEEAGEEADEEGVTEEEEKEDDQQITTFGFGLFNNPPPVDGDELRLDEFKINGEAVDLSEAVDVKNGDEAYFKFSIPDIPAGHDYKPGSQLTFDLPNVFGNINASGFTEIADVTTSGNTVIFTFNENVIDDLSGDGASLDNIWFEIEATLDKNDDKLNETVEIPGGGELELNFTPKDGNPVSKKTNNVFQTNADSIEWEAIVNTDFAAKNEGTVNFVDFLGNDANHKFKEEDVTIQEVTIPANGGPDQAIDKGSAITITPSYNSDLTEMTLELDGTKAYKIIYKTYPEDPGNGGQQTYKNSAKYDGSDPKDAQSWIQFDTGIKKSVGSAQTDLTTEWEIVVNENKRNLADITVTDKWTTSGVTNAKQELVGDVEVYKNNETSPVANDGSVYTFNQTNDITDNQGFNIVFVNDVGTDTYTIKYTTKPTDNTYINNDMTVTNNVTRSDNPDIFKDNESVTYRKSNFTLDKGSPAIDYKEKTIDWKIEANQSSESLVNPVFEDRYGSPNMTLDDTKLVVEVDGTATTDYTLTKQTNGDGEETGFDIAFTGTIDKPVTITYTTKYDIRDHGKNTEDYENTVTLKSENLPDTSDSHKRPYTQKQEQRENGKKTGQYNYDTKRFEWEVLLNFNYNTLNNAVFEDEIKNGPAQTIENIVITPGELDAGGEFQPGTPVEIENTADAPNKIKLVLGEISTPYKITYESYVTSEIIPETPGKLEVENEATLKDGNTPNADWSKKVGVNYTEKLINKLGNQDGNTPGIKWNFEFNYAQSNLKNIVISDEVGKDADGNPNQLYVEDSFKVYEVTLSGTSENKGYGAAAIGSEVDLNEPGYDLSVDIKEGTFKLELPDGDKAYYVEYETIYQGSNYTNQSEDKITNSVAVAYNDNEGTQADTSDSYSFAQFNYSGGGNVTKVPFIAIKTDAATGKPMEGIEFTLHHAATDRPLISDVTNNEGIFDIGMNLSEVEYYLTEENLPDDYKDPGQIPFKLHRDSVVESGPFAGKQVVYVENEPELEQGQKVCENFTLTVKDENKDPVQNKDVKLVNKKTGEIYKGTTNDDGEVTKPRAELPAGEYEVYVDGDTEDDTYIDDMTVKYIGKDDVGCVDEVSPETTSVSGTKTWKDGNSENRPTEITVNLLADETQVADKEVTGTSDDNVWEYEFTNLPKYTKAIGEEKHEVVYTVEEVEVDGYESTVDDYNITNLRTSDDTIEIPVEKVWEGPKVETEPVTINLLADGEIEADLVLSEDNDWKDSFENLAIYNVKGEDVEYTVEEVEVEGYNTETTGNAKDGFTVINTQKTYAIGDYVWVDYNSDGTQNESEKAALEGVTVELYDAEGNKLEDKTTKTDENGLYIFDELVAGEYKVKFKLTEEQAKKYKFTEKNQGDATEDSDADNKGWTTEIKLDDDNKQLTDSYTDQTVKATEGIDPTWDAGVIELTEVTVNKTWKDDKETDRPESIKVNLKQNGTVIGEEVEIEANDDGEWTHTFTGLTKYAEEDEEYEYTVSEHDVEGYAVSYDQDNLEITNTRADEKSITINKSWLDNDDATENRPDLIEVELFRSIENSDLESVDTYTVKAEDDWSLTIDKLPAFDKDGKAYTYEIEEIEVDGYESTINGFDITNLRVGKTGISGEKTWVDNDDKKKLRPESITVNLLANGEPVEGKSLEVTADDEWAYTFTDLDKFDEDGAEITYTVDEAEVPEHYKKSSDESKLNITNTLITYAIGDYVWIDSNKDGLQDENEKILEGVTVELYEEGNDEPIATTTTNDKGLYIFDELLAGDYQVKFTLTEEQAKKYKFTETNAGDDTTVDSDADANGYTTQFTLDENNEHLTTDYKDQEVKASEGIDPTWDAGVIEKTEVTITKDWKDQGESTRPASITVDFLADEEKVEEYELTAENGWTLKVTELDKYDAAGNEIDYTVKEHNVSEYNSKVDGTDITNTQKTYAIGDYVWVDYNKDGLQDENEKALEGVTVELYEEGNDEPIATTTTNDKGLYIFDKLVAGDYQVKFTLTEEQEKKYKFTKQNAGDDTTVDSDADANGYTTQFTLDEDNEQLTKDYGAQDFKATEGIDPTWDAGVIELVDVTGTKTWVNDHNKSEELPASITVNLIANGEEKDSQKVTAEDDWTYTFAGLDKYDENGEEIKYSVTEDAVDGYKVSYDGNNITNTKVCEKFTVEVEKEEDGSPVTEEEFTFESEDGKKITTKTDKDGKITFDRKDLPEGKYTVTDKDGNKIGEIEVEYNEDCKDNVAIVIVPKEDPKVCEEVEITVTEDGKPSKDKTYTLTSKDGKTTVTITTDKDGKAIVDRDELPNGEYTVTDADGNVVGTVTIGENCKVAIDIVSEKEEVEPTPTPPTKGDTPTPTPSTPTPDKGDTEAGKGGSLPSTATNIFNIAFFGGILLLAGIAMYFARRKKTV